MIPKFVISELISTLNSIQIYTTVCSTLSLGYLKLISNLRHPNWKGERILSLFVDDMMIYRENPKNLTKKTIIRTNK